MVAWPDAWLRVGKEMASTFTSVAADSRCDDLNPVSLNPNLRSHCWKREQHDKW